MNPMKNIKIEKLTLNVGAGKDQAKLNKGVLLLKHITGIEPVKTKTDKRIPSWGIRPGLPIGCKLTLRKQTQDFIARFLAARDNLLEEDNFDHHGNISFGIPEYIDIPGVKYNPEIGIAGFQVCITLTRPGYRVKKRRLHKAKVGKKHIISKADAMDFMKNTFHVKIGEQA